MSRNERFDSGVNEARPVTMLSLCWEDVDDPPADEFGADARRVGHAREFAGGNERFGKRRGHQQM